MNARVLVTEILGNKDRPKHENPEIIIKTIILVYFSQCLFSYLYQKQAICYILYESKLGYSVRPAFRGWVVICLCYLITSEMMVTAVRPFHCPCVPVSGTLSLLWRLRFLVCCLNSAALGVFRPQCVFTSQVLFGLTSRSDITDFKARGSHSVVVPRLVGCLCIPTCCACMGVSQASDSVFTYCSVPVPGPVLDAEGRRPRDVQAVLAAADASAGMMVWPLFQQLARSYTR